jgi:hypothetical protein
MAISATNRSRRPIYRLELGAHHAGGFALRLLRADAAAYRRQSVSRLQNPIGSLEILVLNGGDKAGDVDAHGAAGDAARLLAAQTAVGFVQGAFQVEPQRHFLEVVAPLFGRLMRHGNALRRDALEVLGKARTGRGRHRFRKLAGGARLAAGNLHGLEAGELGGFVAVAIHGGLLFALETFLAERELVEIHQVAVEIGAVHAGEFHFAAHRDAARSAHARAVHHDGIEAHHGGDAERPGGVAAGLHHGQGPDGHHFADVLFGG